jgi:soluble lytic murein transglycosylase-like protein
VEAVYQPATIECVIRASNYQGVPANVLLAIGSMENGKNGQAVRNNNGTYDLGHMQINTSTYKAEIAKYGIGMDEVRWNGCKNVEIAAFLLRKRLSENNDDDFWTKVANYHSKTPMYNARYKSKIMPLAHKWADWLQNEYKSAKVVYH